MTFMTVKEIPETEQGVEPFGSVPANVVCSTITIDGIPAITFRGKIICDADSQMAKDYFKRIA